MKHARTLSILVEWGRVHRRVFPWRGEKDPFKLLVAEVLLQRSRSSSVATVLKEFFHRWPDASALISAPIGEVEKMLYPLGLVGRAGTIVQLATAYLKLQPRTWTPTSLRSLPGVGPITAASVSASLGLGLVPIDAVSRRVYERSIGQTTEGLDKTLAVLCLKYEIPTDELNWAALDLASAICMPKHPRCEGCPLCRVCQWNNREH